MIFFYIYYMHTSLCIDQTPFFLHREFARKGGVLDKQTDHAENVSNLWDAIITLFRHCRYAKRQYSKTLRGVYRRWGDKTL